MCIITLKYFCDMDANLNFKNNSKLLIRSERVECATDI